MKKRYLFLIGSGAPFLFILALFKPADFYFYHPERNIYLKVSRSWVGDLLNYELRSSLDHSLVHSETVEPKPGHCWNCPVDWYENRAEVRWGNSDDAFDPTILPLGLEVESLAKASKAKPLKHSFTWKGGVYSFEFATNWSSATGLLLVTRNGKKYSQHEVDAQYFSPISKVSCKDASCEVFFYGYSTLDWFSQFRPIALKVDLETKKGGQIKDGSEVDPCSIHWNLRCLSF